MDFLKFYYKWKLDREQKKINKDYELHGLTEDILERQAALNKERFERNIAEKNDYVQ